MRTKLGKVVIYFEKLPSTKLHNLLNTWSLEATGMFKSIISTITISVATKPGGVVMVPFIKLEVPLITWSYKFI